MSSVITQGVSVKTEPFWCNLVFTDKSEISVNRKSSQPQSLHTLQQNRMGVSSPQCSASRTFFSKRKHQGDSDTRQEPACPQILGILGIFENLGIIGILPLPGETSRNQSAPPTLCATRGTTPSPPPWPAASRCMLCDWLQGESFCDTKCNHHSFRCKGLRVSSFELPE